MDNGRWDNNFGWIMFALTLLSVAGTIYFCFSRANNSDGGAKTSGEGTEMGYVAPLLMEEDQRTA